MFGDSNVDDNDKVYEIISDCLHEMAHAIKYHGGDDSHYDYLPNGFRVLNEIVGAFQSDSIIHATHYEIDWIFNSIPMAGQQLFALLLDLDRMVLYFESSKERTEYDLSRYYGYTIPKGLHDYEEFNKIRTQKLENFKANRYFITSEIDAEILLTGGHDRALPV